MKIQRWLNALQFVLVALKVLGVIRWSWWLVFTPWLAGGVVVLGLILVFVGYAAFAVFVGDAD